MAHCREMLEYPEEGFSICRDSKWLVSRMAGLTTTKSPDANEEQRLDGNAHVTRETADLIQRSLISMRDARNPARTLYSASDMAKLSKTRLARLPSAISVCDHFIRKKQGRGTWRACFTSSRNSPMQTRASVVSWIGARHWRPGGFVKVRSCGQV